MKRVNTPKDGTENGCGQPFYLTSNSWCVVKFCSPPDRIIQKMVGDYQRATHFATPGPMVKIIPVLGGMVQMKKLPQGESIRPEVVCQIIQVALDNWITHGIVTESMAGKLVASIHSLSELFPGLAVPILGAHRV